MRLGLTVLSSRDLPCRRWWRAANCFHLGQLFVPAPVERVHAFIHWTKLGDRAFIDGPALVSWRYAGDPVRFGS